MIKEKGTISINTENIFPIIKKFLYSDHEIFLRELVSNAIDATQKIKRLSSLGQYNKELGELTVQVKVNKKKKTIPISDAGLGMTAEELKNISIRLHFLAPLNSWKNSKKPKMPMKLLDALVLDSIQRSWWRKK